ncbi:4286_t:CDS:2, partial [Ambispora leptoticha]
NNLELQALIQTKRNYVQLKAYMLLHLANVHLLKSEFDDAEKVLSTLINWTTTHSILQHYEASITLALGLLNQSVGKVIEARNYYRAVEKITTNKELIILAKINRVLIELGNTIETILNEIRQESLVENGNVNSLKSTFHILEALASNDIIRTRDHLFESLKLSTTLCNDQLKAIALAVLGTLFYHTQNEQAEKMLKAAYQLSKGAHNDLWCLVAGVLLK